MWKSSISQSEIIDTVSAIRAEIASTYEWAKKNGRYDWLNPSEGDTPTMKKLQIHMRTVFDMNHRGARLKTTEAVLGIEDLEIGSFKDLNQAELSGLISGFEDMENFHLVLSAIGTDPKGWERRLASIQPLRRPGIKITGWEEVDDAW